MISRVINVPIYYLAYSVTTSVEKIIKKEEKKSAAVKQRMAEISMFCYTDTRFVLFSCPTTIWIILYATTFQTSLQYDFKQNLSEQVTANSCIMDLHSSKSRIFRALKSANVTAKLPKKICMKMYGEMRFAICMNR